MRTLACLALLVVSFAISTPATAQTPAQKRPAAANQGTLSPGDSVRIVVWRKPEFSGDFVVAPDGSITHPLFRGVKVTGVPFATAEANVRQFLSGFEENPQFVFEPLIRVAVSGEVSRPAVFALPPETSIGEAIARAGGTGPNGARNRVRVLRLMPTGQQTTYRLNLEDPNRTDGTEPVKSGDQIIVDRRKSLFKDFLLPALTVIGSIASIGLLIERYGRNNN